VYDAMHGMSSFTLLPHMRKNATPSHSIALASLRAWAILLCLLLLPLPLFAFEYTVAIDGVQDKELLHALKTTSQTIVTRKKKPITTLHALRKRVEADLGKMNDTCHYYGYLESHVSFSIARGETPKVIFHVLLGPLYTIKEISLVSGSEDAFHTLQPFPDITPAELGITIGAPASTKTILAAEEKALERCRSLGYAFCKSIKKQAVADGADHTLSVTFFLDTGPLVKFGKTTIIGTHSVDATALHRFIAWQEGALYNPEKIRQTTERLEKSGLFSRSTIQEQQSHFANGELPITIIVDEAKHKSIGTSISYMTTKGPGAHCNWENRNIRGMGEKISVNCDVWRQFQTLILSYRRPHTPNYEDERLYAIEFNRQDTIAYFSQEVSLALSHLKHWYDNLESSLGGKLESLHSNNFEGKATYYLVKMPLSLRWRSVKNRLDPLTGQLLHTKLTPAYQCITPNFFYLNHTSTATYYYSLFEDSITLATKLVFGNIFGAAKHTIPPPDRFFSGSESTLRGYRYLTVSPLNKHGKPTGGRSLLAGSLEARMRTSSGIGWVLFYDVGNVYSVNFPVLDEKLLQSVGIGARYSTPLGPLRLDIAVPLNRRHRLDPPFQVYFSIGQAF